MFQYSDCSTGTREGDHDIPSRNVMRCVLQRWRFREIFLRNKGKNRADSSSVDSAALICSIPCFGILPALRKVRPLVSFLVVPFLFLVYTTTEAKENVPFLSGQDGRGSELLAEARMQVNEDQKRNILRSVRSVNTPHDIPGRNVMDALARLANAVSSGPFGTV